MVTIPYLAIGINDECDGLVKPRGVTVAMEKVLAVCSQVLVVHILKHTNTYTNYAHSPSSTQSTRIYWYTLPVSE